MALSLQPSGRRAGATWVAATGAFLLLAGAAVFVAVRWDHLSEVAKLGLIVALTASFLVGGRSARATLPATGDVLFHLGAFLLPVDLAALGLRAGTGWRPLLLAEGVLGVLAFGGLALATRSVVLHWAAVASMAVLAAGVAAVSPVPAPLVLATAAVLLAAGTRVLRTTTPLHGAGPAAVGGGLDGACVIWATVAGLAPMLWAAVTLVAGIGRGTAVDLGLAGRGPSLSALLTGALAAGVLARQARRSDDLRLAYLALASFVVAAITAAMGARLSAGTTLVGLAALFVVGQLAALMSADDPFWAHPLSAVAAGSEVSAIASTFVAAAVVLAAPFAVHIAPRPLEAAAFALLALGLLTADIRRYHGTPRPFGLTLLRGGSWAPATVPMTLAALAAIELATASVVAGAVTMVVLATLAVASDRPWGEVVAAALAPWAVVTAAAFPATAVVLGVVGAAVVAEAAVRRSRLDGAPGTDVLLAGAASATALLAVAVGHATLGDAAAVAAAVPACWLLALQLDRGASSRWGPWDLGDVARGALIVPAIAALGLSAGDALPPMVAITVLLAADAVRLRRPRVAIGAALAVQGVVVEAALATGISVSAAGLALCVAAVVWAGLAVVADRAWRRPFLVAAGGGLGLGLALAALDPAAFANGLLIAGGLGVGAGIAGRRADLAHIGGILLWGGTANHLELRGVQASEPFLVPVAVHLLVAGWYIRRHRAATAPRGQVSSWLAYAPAVAVLGGAGLAERVAGGPGWHALVAGGVGVIAVVIGGWRRLAGPMLVGTALLVAVTVHESLSTLAGVPTWAWLSLGGSVLLGAGVAMERGDTSPAEAGRRVVDVLAERFS